MSQTVIFSIGAVVWAITVWGAVMAAGIRLGRLQDDENARPSVGKPPARD